MYLFKTVLPCDKVEFVDTGACIPVLVSNCLPSTVIDRRFGLRHLARNEIQLEWAGHELQYVSCKQNTTISSLVF